MLNKNKSKKKETKPSIPLNIRVKIEEKEVEVYSDDKNIVDLARRVGVGIPAPCYTDKHSKGCCKVCVVDINGKERYACSTAPEDGMVITVIREDLLELRRQRAAEYKENELNGCSCR